MDPTQRRRNADQGADATPMAAVTVKEAADRLDLSTEAVRMRLRRGTLAGRKEGGGWVVLLQSDATPEDDRRNAVATPDTSPSQRQHGGDATVSDPDATTDATTDQVDATPLVALVADLARRNEELAAAAAHWQARVVVLGERLAALEAGPLPSEAAAMEPLSAPPQAPGATELTAPVVRSSRSLWGRLRSLFGG